MWGTDLGRVTCIEPSLAMADVAESLMMGIAAIECVFYADVVDPETNRSRFGKVEWRQFIPTTKVNSIG